MNYQDKLAKRKEALKTAAEFSDNALDQLARAELGDETINKIQEVCDNMDKLMKTQGISRDWKTHPKYEYGLVNGMIAKFITQFIYLPDALKSTIDIKVPKSAFTSEMLDDWGTLPYCTALGQIVPGTEPNFQSVQTQIEMVRAYLNLDYIDTLITPEQWKEKATIAQTKAEKKQADVEAALLEDSLERELGLPTFSV